MNMLIYKIRIVTTLLVTTLRQDVSTTLHLYIYNTAPPTLHYVYNTTVGVSSRSVKKYKTYAEHQGQVWWVGVFDYIEEKYRLYYPPRA